MKEKEYGALKNYMEVDVGFSNLSENTNEFDVFSRYESEVRTYCRTFPAIFKTAKGSIIKDVEGVEYIDLVAGAGALNYGHNNELIKKAVIDYIQEDGILMGLDFHSQAKATFINTFVSHILAPRNLQYKLQFTSPTGTSVVESALKLARKYTGRSSVVSFTNAFHGMTGNSLSATGSKHHRQHTSIGNVVHMPYEGYLGDQVDTVDYFRKLLIDKSSGLDLPAAVILETVQGEGGLNVASVPWLKKLRQLTAEYDIPLIVDDIQAGCGRTGHFFSFERAEIQPDMVCLSKSLGGIGLPFALLLLSPHLDKWKAGEDNGTFRGHNLAFVASTVALQNYWHNDAFSQEIIRKGNLVTNYLTQLVLEFHNHLVRVKGIGLMQGIEFKSGEMCSDVKNSCFQRNLIIEDCGNEGHILKLMPTLDMEQGLLQRSLEIIRESIVDVIQK
jgi:diaminobutyrate-2-oxoglutarate transaminase